MAVSGMAEMGGDSPVKSLKSLAEIGGAGGDSPVKSLKLHGKSLVAISAPTSVRARCVPRAAELGGDSLANPLKSLEAEIGGASGDSMPKSLKTKRSYGGAELAYPLRGYYRRRRGAARRSGRVPR